MFVWDSCLWGCRADVCPTAPGELSALHPPDPGAPPAGGGLWRTQLPCSPQPCPGSWLGSPPRVPHCPPQWSQLQPSKAFSAHPWWYEGLLTDQHWDPILGDRCALSVQEGCCVFINHPQGRSCRRNLQCSSCLNQQPATPRAWLSAVSE